MIQSRNKGFSPHHIRHHFGKGCGMLKSKDASLNRLLCVKYYYNIMKKNTYSTGRPDKQWAVCCITTHIYCHPYFNYLPFPYGWNKRFICFPSSSTISNSSSIQ
jgi:hypothetical protein